ncbi:MAG TPA: putative Ig domain-containing protein, partial [Blastocatellia bacterium]|nr:putative Ig domain-containing protein [Blastocatellia bacterium]
GTPGDGFGNAVAISGDKALIGASLFGADDRGTVYSFKRSGTNWAQNDVINSPFPKPNARFGAALALDGNAAVIGASLGLFDNGADRREAYVFVNASNVWGFTRQLDLDTGTADDRFGFAVAIDGDVVLAGAYRGDGAVASSGAAYAFVMRDSRYVESPRVIANDGAADDRFGQAVAMDGNTLVIGAKYDDIGQNTDQGSVYVFVRNGANWAFQQKLTAPNGAAVDLFGASVAVTGDLLVAGAPGYDSGQVFDIGAAYLFKRSGTTWTFQQKLIAAALESDEQDTFGDSVAIHGRTIAVSATGADALRGAVYVFRATNDVWFEEMKITAADSAFFDFFGSSISLYNDTLAVGVPFHKVGTKASQGAVYVYARSGTSWPLQKKITDSFGAEKDFFGAAVSLHGDTLAIGVPATDNTPARLGSTYIFNRTGSSWTREAKINAADGQENDGFGISVSLRNETLAVGTVRGTDNQQTTTGRAYVFTRIGSWRQQQKLMAANRSNDDRYGSAVAVSGDAVAVGAYSSTIGNNAEQGAVYVFAGPVCPAISIAPLGLPNATAGVSYSQQLTATGGATADYQFVLSHGTLPPGLTLNEAGSLQGTPSAGGVFSFTVAARNALSLCPGSRDYTITVSANCPTIAVSPASLPNGAVGTIYNQTMTATGGTSPHSFTVSAGALPGGLTLFSNGTLTGTPVIAGTFNFTITATDTNGCTGSRSYSVTISDIGGGGGTTGLQFYPLAHPVRLLETRAGQSGCFTPGAPIAGGTSRTQPARGICDGLTIPANAAAITGNITTVQSGGGYLTLYPSNSQQPLVANSNYGPNEILNNVFTVGLGNDGAFKIFALNTTDVVVDVTGYYAPPAASGLYFHPLPKPIRLLETRAGQTGCFTPNAPLQGGTNTAQLGQTSCGGVTIPAGAQALVGNATTVGPQGGGYLTLYPANAAQPLVASSNFLNGQVMNAPFTVGLSPSGDFNIFTTTTTDLVVDVLGYYSAQLNDVNGAGLLLYSLPSPTRLLDTRLGTSGCFTPGAP